ncbi:sugar transferase [Anabaena sphaerica FACHB-251]|uniref:Sugar transferase n=1 Tax=Anabaena sphaerica FACHB-251 TaxID=2692883 RepID=A0A926ZZQ9_9NOST|nr:sugar transferase [Anabaena sphaerica]MBD2292671.1 sugar transferase [Anabaena sphaerica FACHB-251]
MNPNATNPQDNQTSYSINQNLKLPVLLDDISLPQELPPIVLLAFTRPDLLQEVLPAIAQQTLHPSQILAFIDGPRNEKDQLLIDQCISLLTEFSHTIPVKIIKQPHNLGCDAHAIWALTETFSHYPAAIYLEDDTIPHPYFYDRMCRLLEAYRHFTQVFSITAYANFPSEIRELISEDFMVSRRIFALGLATWADRWQNLNLADYPQGYNPFGHFYKIPATIQTKYTIINQFFIEAENKKDWVITLTLAALYQGYIHITPMVSLVHNIGFGHSQAKTYNTGTEPSWANAHSDPSACPNKLPSSLELIKPLADYFDGVELAKHLESSQSLWLSPSGIWYLLGKYSGWGSRVAFLKLFFSRILILIRRWRSGKPI